MDDASIRFEDISRQTALSKSVWITLKVLKFGEKNMRHNEGQYT